eukprot:6192803-Pleurochrysis_carterae.AAC.1
MGVGRCSEVCCYSGVAGKQSARQLSRPARVGRQWPELKGKEPSGTAHSGAQLRSEWRGLVRSNSYRRDEGWQNEGHTRTQTGYRAAKFNRWPHNRVTRPERKMCRVGKEKLWPTSAATERPCFNAGVDSPESSAHQMSQNRARSTAAI